MARKYVSRIRGLKTKQEFGKTPKYMSDEERKEYNKLKKIKSRNKPEIYMREKEQRKKYYYQNLEKQREKCKKYYWKNRDEILAKNRVKTPFGNCLPMKIIGCHVKDMNKEQRRKFFKIRLELYREKKLKNLNK